MKVSNILWNISVGIAIILVKLFPNQKSERIFLD